MMTYKRQIVKVARNIDKDKWTVSDLYAELKERYKLFPTEASIANVLKSMDDIAVTGTFHKVTRSGSRDINMYSYVGDKDV